MRGRENPRDREGGRERERCTVHDAATKQKDTVHDTVITVTVTITVKVTVTVTVTLTLTVTDKPRVQVLFWTLLLLSSGYS